MIPRLSEVNRILQVLKVLKGTGPAHTIPINYLILLCREVVFEGRLPDHVATVDFACHLGFIFRIEDEVGLTDEGEVVLALNPLSSYELTKDQERFLVKKCYLNGHYSTKCRNLFQRFSISYEKNRLQWLEADGQKFPEDGWLIDHLIQLGVIERNKGTLYTSPTYQDLIAEFIDQPKGMTDERLRQLLKEKQEVGDVAEELAEIYERNRLKNLDCMVEADCMRRISNIRVNAGFDIESFNGKSPGMAFDRFIEVKGSKQKNLRFFWSENEMAKAEELGEKYWIYFQGGIDLASKSANAEPILFQNPIVSIMGDTNFAKTPQGVLVERQK